MRLLSLACCGERIHVNIYSKGQRCRKSVHSREQRFEEIHQSSDLFPVFWRDAKVPNLHEDEEPRRSRVSEQVRNAHCIGIADAVTLLPVPATLQKQR
jgi:hypothetical protein